MSETAGAPAPPINEEDQVGQIVPVDDNQVAVIDGSHDDLAIPDEQRTQEIEQLNQQYELEPPKQEEAPEQLHIAIGSVEDVRHMARDAADARIASETQGGGGFKGFIRRIWKGNMAREYYQQKYQREAENEIVETGNLHIHHGGDQESSDQTMQSVVQRLTHKHADELISASAGESKQRIDNVEDEQAVAVKEGIFSLIDRFASGELDEDNFEEEKNRTLRELAGEHPDLMGEGLLFADNLLEIAQNVKAMVRHDRGVQDILESARIDIGQVNTGVRTEARFTKTDEIIDKIQKSKVGQWFNETTVITAASAIAAATKVTVQKGVARAAAVTGVLGVGGAIIAGARESKRIKEERRQHFRERAMGMEFDESAKRRAELEETRYESLSATELTQSLDSLFEDGEAGLKKLRPDLTEADYFEAVGLIAQIRTRNRLSDERNIDLIHFSSAESVADERLQLDLTTIYAETALEQFLEEKGGVSWLREAGLNQELDSFEKILEIHGAVVEAEFTEDMSAKDAVFRKVHRDHVIKAAVIGGTIGMVVGTATQEAMAHLPGIGDSLYGVGEGKAPMGGRNTLLGGLFHRGEGSGGQHLTDLGGSTRMPKIEGFTSHQDASGNWVLDQTGTGKHITLQHDASGMLTPESKAQLQDLGLGVHSEITTPTLSGETQHVQLGFNDVVIAKEYNLQQVDPGNWNIVDAKGHVVHAMRLNFDGSISDQSVAELQAGGISVNHVSNLVDTRTEVGGLGARDIVNNHLAETNRVHRTLWYGNDTPSPKFDLNELRADAGGVNGSWFDEKGNVVFDVSRMHSNWSFQGGQSVDPFTATGEGRLSLAISVSRDTQANVFDFSFHTTPDGRTIATIPPESPVHQLFQMQGNKRVFTGAFAEVMEHTGVQSSTGENVNMLATLPGQNSAHNLTDVIGGTQLNHTTTLGVMPGPENVQVITYDAPVVAPPVIPIAARRGLENPLEREEIPAQRSNEVEVWRDRTPVKVPAYKKREVELYQQRSTDVERYDPRIQLKRDEPKQKQTTQTQQKIEQPESYKLNGSEYNREQVESYIRDYLGQLDDSSAFMELLDNQDIDSPEAFVAAVERQLAELNEQYTDSATGQVDEKGLRIASQRFFPDHNIFSFGRIISFVNNDRQLVTETDANGNTQTVTRRASPGLELSNPTARSILALMYQTRRR